MQIYKPTSNQQTFFDDLLNMFNVMKVFKFYCGELYYAYAAQTKEEAIEQFTEETGDQYTAIDEIPESEWDKKMISVWEDNDFDKKPFKISIREAICGVDAQMIFSNDTASW